MIEEGWLIRWCVQLRSLRPGLALSALLVTCAWASEAPGVQVKPAMQAPQDAMSLKVLPPDTPREDVKRLMRQYKTDLGVECSYCHTKYEDTGDVDYASEENPMKAKARLMIEMTNEINARFLAQLGDRRYAEPFGCEGCHRGRAKLSDSEG